MFKTNFFSFWIKQYNITSLKRFACAASERKRICIIGSGPAGFYTAQHLLKEDHTEVDIFEKLPVPFGLIRYGVAPDHPEIKNVTKLFTNIGMHERCKYFGNVNVGKDVMISDLLQSYHAIVLAYGANYDKEMNIPGENSKNVLPARQIVGWYTGHPDFVGEQIDLNTDVATVIGHGNVAIDVARILVQDLNKLKTTDITECAYETLKKSRLKRVIIVGRRGPLQVSFTIKEFRELSKLPNCRIEVKDSTITKLFDSVHELNLERPYKRMFELMADLYKRQSSTEVEKCVEFKYFRTPKEIISDKNGKVEKMVFKVNELEDLLSAKSSKLTVTEKEDIINCGLVVRSIGYKGLPIEPVIPFDHDKCVIPNKKGKVIDREGLYCSGWLKSGPVGVIVSTMSNSYGTATQLLEDIENGELSRNLSRGRDDILDLLKKKGVKYVTFQDWLKIDKYELEKGQAIGKEREKLYNVNEMLKFV
ncbi:NADPH:adrenodoxin oxidoreductase, mitochondrial [Trichonephila inaurata madagascariensis]|uniref:NADPH:adrenodoxin oxidoreductase, mitochondrial n=1 Tax=Trichonephila inaurata madagascariensis TaxID=2747483 RepID=A0A8X6WMG6_9ARAC|nr:NADPH:adrenodoxin oxidoreductase, mitochondrial [Trichonephila inaurata madagascariensis]